MAGKDGEVEEFTEGERTRERIGVEAAAHSQGSLQQVSDSLEGSLGKWLLFNKNCLMWLLSGLLLRVNSFQG